MLKLKVENERRNLGGVDGAEHIERRGYVTKRGVEIVANRSSMFDWPVLIIYAFIFVIIVGLSVFLCICFCDSSEEDGGDMENSRRDEGGQGQSALERSYQ